MTAEKRIAVEVMKLQPLVFCCQSSTLTTVAEKMYSLLRFWPLWIILNALLLLLLVDVTCELYSFSQVFADKPVPVDETYF